jgi:hypothetical protein
MFFAGKSGMGTEQKVESCSKKYGYSNQRLNYLSEWEKAGAEAEAKEMFDEVHGGEVFFRF